MFERILSGEQPSAVFRQAMRNDAALTNNELASRFYEEFPKLDSVVVQYIWHWKSPDHKTGNFSDEHLDEVLIDALRAAGYR
ncbi:MAG: hypothetical protein V4505_22350 [Pseudomonadota bacterium]